MATTRAAPLVIAALFASLIVNAATEREGVVVKGAWFGPAGGRRHMASNVEHVNDFAEKPSVEWGQPSRIYQTADNRNRVIEKAMGFFLAKDQSVHWKQWKRASLNLYFADTTELGSWERNTTGATCSRSPQCEDRCRESCLMDRIRQHCHHKKCSAQCSIVPGSCNTHGRHCRYDCSDSCMTGCVKSELFHFKKELATCMPSKLGKCFRGCHKNRKTNRPKDFIRCGKGCVDSAQMACIGAHTRPCQEQCGRHSCVHGTCVCPGMLSGDDECAAKPEQLWEGAPDLSRHCFQSFFEPKFKGDTEGTTMADISYTSPEFRSTQETWSLYHWFASFYGKRKTETHPDLPSFSEWTSCALIGSSGSLTGSGMGKTIDERHTAWIRFNDAPTVGFEEDVGSRTTLRIQNNVYCGFNEGKQELCAPYTKFSTRRRCHPTEGRQCPLVQFSDTVHNAVHDFMRPEFYNHPTVDVNDDHWNTTGHVDTSAGFFGALMALHLCGEVTLYGFDQAPTHYYQKKASLTKKPFETRHGWGAEHYCFAEYRQRFPGFRILEASEFAEYKASLGGREQSQATERSEVEQREAERGEEGGMQEDDERGYGAGGKEFVEEGEERGAAVIELQHESLRRE